MADSFVLRNDGSYVLRNDGSRILRNGIAEAVLTPTISHTTLDAGVDLRNRRVKKQHKQVLILSLDVPVSGNLTKRMDIPLKMSGIAKRTETIPLKAKGSLTSTSVVPLELEGSLISKQKTVAGIIGSKKFSKAMRSMKETIEKKDKIDTLKELLRLIDEE